MESPITESTEVSILDRVLRAATIEEIEAEMERLSKYIVMLKENTVFAISKTMKSIETLNVIHKALIVQRDVKLPAREKPEGEVKVRRRRRGPGGGETISDRVEKLLKEQGGMKISQLEAALNKPYGTIYSVLQCDRFTYEPQTKRFFLAMGFE